MKKNIFTKNFKFILLTMFLISIALIFLLYTISNLEKKIEHEIFNISTSDIRSIVQNNSKLIEQKLEGKNNYVSALKNNIQLRNEIEKNLQLLITNHVKYAYLLYKDENGIFRFLVDASSINKAFLNQKFDIESEEWLDIYKTKKETIINHNILQQLSITFIHPILNKDDVQLILAIDFSANKLTNVNEIINNIKQGTIFFLVIILTSLIIVIYQIIRYLKIKNVVYTDSLTGAYNRSFMTELEKNIDLDDYVLSVLDIDYFKKINDNYGHDVGDIILKDLVKTLSSSIRLKDDYIIRYGGEEFVMLTKKVKDKNFKQIDIINRIRHVIEDTKFYISKNKYLHITVSIGVNLNPIESKSLEQAFKLADIALYKAKNAGRNCVKVYEEE